MNKELPQVDPLCPFKDRNGKIVYAHTFDDEISLQDVECKNVISTSQPNLWAADHSHGQYNNITVADKESNSFGESPPLGVR